MNAFPEALWDEKNTIIGTPDAGDWGGFYIEVLRNGKRHFWLLDKMLQNVPKPYHDFLNQVDKKIGLMQQSLNVLI